MCRYSGDLTGHIQTTLKISSLQATEAKGSQQLSSPGDRAAEGWLFSLGLLSASQNRILRSAFKVI